MNKEFIIEVFFLHGQACFSAKKWGWHYKGKPAE